MRQRQAGEGACVMSGQPILNNCSLVAVAISAHHRILHDFQCQRTLERGVYVVLFVEAQIDLG